MSSRTQLLTTSALRIDSRLPLELRHLNFSILPSPPSAPNAFAASALPPAQADGYAIVSHGLTTVSASVFGPREPAKTGPFSAAGGSSRPGDKASVNVEVGVAGWSERNTSNNAAGLRKGGRDRCVLFSNFPFSPICPLIDIVSMLSQRLSIHKSIEWKFVEQINFGCKNTNLVHAVCRKTIELSSALKATFEPVLLLHLYPRSAIDIYIQVLEVDGCTFSIHSHMTVDH